jgi:hypothetical protein
MSLFRYKGSRVWTLDFVFQGQRIRESTGTRNKSLARTIERIGVPLLRRVPLG